MDMKVAQTDAEAPNDVVAARKALKPVEGGTKVKGTGRSDPSMNTLHAKMAAKAAAEAKKDSGVRTDPLDGRDMDDLDQTMAMGRINLKPGTKTVVKGTARSDPAVAEKSLNKRV